MSQVKSMVILVAFTAVLGFGIMALAIYKPSVMLDITHAMTEPAAEQSVGTTVADVAVQ